MVPHGAGETAMAIRRRIARRYARLVRRAIGGGAGTFGWAGAGLGALSAFCRAFLRMFWKR